MAMLDDVRRELGAVAAELVASEDTVQQCLDLCSDFKLDAKALAIKCDTFMTKDMQLSMSRGDRSAEGSRKLLSRFRTYLRETMFDTPVKAPGTSLVSISTPMPLKRKASDLAMYGIETHQHTVRTPTNTIRTTPAPPIKVKVEPRETTEMHSFRQKLNFDAPIETPAAPKPSPTKALSTLNAELPDVPMTLSLPTFSDLVQVSPKAFTMVDNLQKRSMAIDQVMTTVEKTLVSKHNITEPAPLSDPSQAAADYIGRICWEQEGGSSNEKLGRQHMVLEADRAGHNHRVRLDLSAVPQAACFPGQVVLVNGVNEGRQVGIGSLALSSIVSDAALPVPTIAANPAIRAVIAHGPFIDRQVKTEGTLNYSPITRLMDKALEADANLLVMVGPFVDIYEPHVQSLTDLTYEEVFETEILQKRILGHRLVQQGRTHIVLVPSTRDCHHTNIFPQVPFPVSTRLPATVHMVSNPASFTVGGIRFGVSGHDTIWDMNKNAITRGTGRPRVIDCVRQLVEQQSFYPLYPAPEHSISGQDSLDVAVDFTRSHEMTMKDASPHVLIAPSMMKEFVTEAHGVVCVNPGRLMRTTQTGTLAVLTIQPAVGLDTDAQQAGVGNRTKVDIIRL